MAFDPETYDPYAGYADNAEFWERVDPDNEIPAEERIFTDAMADQIIANDRLRISDLDLDADAQELNQETIVTYRIAVGMDYPAVGVWRKRGQTKIAKHGGPQYKPRDVTTFNRLYGILAGKPNELIPLSHDYTWKHVVADRLSGYHHCDVRISIHCEKDYATAFAIKTGEFVGIYASCRRCRAWFDLNIDARRETQARPLLGFDFRNSAFRRTNATRLSEYDPWGDDDEYDPWGD